MSATSIEMAKPKAGMQHASGVSRETPGSAGKETVSRENGGGGLEMNINPLLANAKSRKIASRMSSTSAPAQQPPQGMNCRPQFLRTEFSPSPITVMLRCSESAVSRSNFRCRSRPIRPPSPSQSIPARTQSGPSPNAGIPSPRSARKFQRSAPCLCRAGRRARINSSAAAPSLTASRSILLRTTHTGTAPLAEFVRAAHRPATAPGPLPPRAPARVARPPAPPDRRSREYRRCRSPSPDSRRDRAALR